MGVINGAVLVGKALKAEGVKYIFSLCGGPILHIFEGCVSEGIEVIDFRLGYGQSPLFSAKAKVIQVAFEPEDIGYNRDVDIGIYGDIKAVLQQPKSGDRENGFGLP